MKQAKIVVVGSLIFDFVASADHLPRVGETVMGDTFSMNTGGKGANQAVQAARLGAQVTMVGRIGRDFQGDTILKNLQKDGVDTRFIVRDETESTACCCIHVDRQGNNTIIIAANANGKLTREDVESAREEICSADLLLLQLEVPQQASLYAAELARQHGVPVVLNPAPAMELEPGLLEMADFFTPNETEAEFFCKINRADHSPQEWEHFAASRLLAQGAGQVLMTLGDRGAYLANSEQEIRIPACKGIRAVDTTGAGDAFHGAFAVAYAEGKTLEQAIRFGNGAGGLSATRRGSQPSLCTRAELEEFLSKQ